MSVSPLDHVTDPFWLPCIGPFNQSLLFFQHNLNCALSAFTLSDYFHPFLTTIVCNL